MVETSYSRLHDWHHDDYDTVREHIYTQIGDLGSIRLFGSQVLCAIYIRPLMNPRTGLQYTAKQQAEDIAQGKTLMVLKTGPSAFSGHAEYIAETWGQEGSPKPDDWVFARASTGEPMHICLDGARLVTHEDRRGDGQPSYEAFQNGWPCRVLMDTDIIGLISKPHQVV
jgi:hypothetical protein